ncbi:MAG TPA: alpha/beta hydrolase-fold protein [Polyangiaceae bacterium]|nr:alpha/beta hydrolase-fold protein [Polyangiaceae bacterium]
MLPRLSSIFVLTLFGAGCGPQESGPAPAPSGTGAQGGSGGSAIAGASGAAGSTGGIGGGAGGAGGSGGSAGSVSLGGSAGTGGSAGSGQGGMFTDPGTDGDGDFTLQPPYQSSPLNDPGGAPVGQQLAFTMSSVDSAIYPGVDGSFTRNVWVYVPSQYVAGTPAPFIVVQDGHYAVWFGTDIPHAPNFDGPNLPGTANLPLILDNLISQGKLPPIVALFVQSGPGDGEGSDRGLEYDTVSGTFAEFVDAEVLPKAASEVQTQLGIDLAFTEDPRGRATLGGSSGGAASFSMAWWHPELFGLVIAYSGTFVRQASPEDPDFPHGCWAYHDFDPYDPATPDGVIVQEPTTKPLRIWLEVGERDLHHDDPEETWHNWPLANRRMAAALAAKGYDYRFTFSRDGRHFDPRVLEQTLPDALEWLWRGWPHS